MTPNGVRQSRTVGSYRPTVPHFSEPAPDGHFREQPVRLVLGGCVPPRLTADGKLHLHTPAGDVTAEFELGWHPLEPHESPHDRRPMYLIHFRSPDHRPKVVRWDAGQLAEARAGRGTPIDLGGGRTLDADETALLLDWTAARIAAVEFALG